MPAAAAVSRTEEILAVEQEKAQERKKSKRFDQRENFPHGQDSDSTGQPAKKAAEKVNADLDAVELVVVDDRPRRQLRVRLSSARHPEEKMVTVSHLMLMRRKSNPVNHPEVQN